MASSSRTSSRRSGPTSRTTRAPDGGRRRRRGASFLARVAVTDYGPGLVRPHGAARPSQGGPPPSHPVHRSQHVADLRPSLRRCLEPPRPGALRRALLRGDRLRRDRPPSLADRRSGSHDAVAAVVAGSELLIADGHHRYETARTYADEVGAGAGADARYTLACLVSLEDPGLSVFATHRLLHDLDEAKRLALRDTLTELFDLEPIDDPADLVPDAGGGTIAYGYMDSFHRKPFRLRLEDDAVLAGRAPGRLAGLSAPSTPPRSRR